MTPIEIERSGPLRRKETRRLDRRLAALPPARDRRARSDVAGGAGGPQDVRLHHRRQRRSGRDLDRVRAAPSSAPARRRCGSTTCAAATRRCRSRTSRSQQPGVGGRHPRRGLRRRRAPALRDRHPVGRAVRLLGRARAAPPIRSACAAAIRSWTLDGAAAAALGPPARAAGRPSRKRTSSIAWISPGGVQHEATLPPGGPVASWTPTGRKSSAWCSARSTAWPGRPSRRSRSPTASATRSAHAFERTGQIILADDLRLRRDRARPRAADDAGRADHDRLRGGRRGRAGASISTCG